jgi:predicted kinase
MMAETYAQKLFSKKAQDIQYENFAQQIIDQEQKDCMNTALMVLAAEIMINKYRMIIIRGIPGSGKSKLANELKNIIKNVEICEADLFMGNNFNPNRLSNCHRECQELARNALRLNNIAIISNTNTTLGEMEIYRKIAIEEGLTEAEIKIIEPLVSWKYNINKCIYIGTHKSVPRHVFEKHLNNIMMEPTTPDILIRMRGFSLL